MICFFIKLIPLHYVNGDDTISISVLFSIKKLMFEFILCLSALTFNSFIIHLYLKFLLASRNEARKCCLLNFLSVYDTSVMEI